ncbi:MAG: nicotinate-nucleotide--dimethylbenzimidazole phosphoribosyltransferase [Chloroflexota bacterium]
MTAGQRRRLDEAIARIGPLDTAAMDAAAARLDRLTKPPGSMGRLEALVIQLAGVTGRPDARVDRRAIVVAAADHGVTRQGVSAYPAEVTPQMVANFIAGGAAINVLAAQVGALVTVVDVGVASPIPEVPPDPADPAGPRRGGRLVGARIRAGTADMTQGPAMTRDEALRAVIVGLDIVDELVADGVDLVGVGEMGIGNTTAASALTAAFTGVAVERVTGRGTGIDDAGRARKVAAVEAALRMNDPDTADPIGTLAAVGGLEIGVLVGVMIGAAGADIPVVLDGFITGSAALIACALAPDLGPRLIAAHRSAEPGHAVVLDHLGLQPLLELDLRLGEGTGAALAMGFLVAAVRIRDEMATFESAAVSGPS